MAVHCSVLIHYFLLVIFYMRTHLVTPIPLSCFPKGTVWFTMCMACPFLKGNLWHFKNITATEKVFSGIYQIFICNPSAQNLCKMKNTDDLDSVFSAKIWSFRFQLSFIWAEEEVQLPSFESQSQWWYLDVNVFITIPPRHLFSVNCAL